MANSVTNMPVVLLGRFKSLLKAKAKAAGAKVKYPTRTVSIKSDGVYHTVMARKR